ncbi:MAG: hypothetical protein PHQ72_11775 [Hespellia sp.]|nr:hypothetical protein [Hespellia sp.]
MVTQEFSKLYYRTANCLTSDIIADFAPVSRIVGVDTSAGLGTVFTAMGTRFDMQYVAKEAFMATDSYESDTRSIDDTPVNEIMRYVRHEIIEGDMVPEAYKPIVEAAKTGSCIYNQYKETKSGNEDADILFLISPAAPDAAKTAEQFSIVSKTIEKSVYCTNQYKDCGYLALQMGLFDEATKQINLLKKQMQQYNVVVTDDSYILDALLVLAPEMAEKIRFIDEFVMEYKNTLKLSENETIMLHQSGVIERLYPEKSVDYKELFASAKIVTPARCGYDVTDSGLAGGLGLAVPENLMAISGRRMADLMKEEHDVIITPCAYEAVGLNCAEKEKVITLLDYICK